MTSATIAFVDDFRDLLTTFADEKVEFVMIGGWALALHGYGRGTDDLDVLVRASTDNAARVFKALVRFGAPVAAHGVTEGLFTQDGYGYRMGVKPHLIEILTKIDGIGFAEVIADSKHFELDGRMIPYIKWTTSGSFTISDLYEPDYQERFTRLESPRGSSFF